MQRLVTTVWQAASHSQSPPGSMDIRESHSNCLFCLYDSTLVIKRSLLKKFKMHEFKNSMVTGLKIKCADIKPHENNPNHSIYELKYLVNRYQTMLANIRETLLWAKMQDTSLYCLSESVPWSLLQRRDFTGFPLSRTFLRLSSQWF